MSKNKGVILMQTKLKFTAIIAAFTVAVSAFTVTAFAQTEKKYNITVLDTAVTSENAANVLAGSENDGKVSYNAETNTLTLNGVNLAYTATRKNVYLLNGSSRTAAAAIVSLRDNLTVNLTGENKIKITTAKRTFSVSGIYSEDDCNLTFTGSGSLDVSTGNAKRDTCGIKCGGLLTVQDTSITATAGNSTYTSGIYNSHGLYGSNGIVISGSKVKAVSGESGTALSCAVMAPKGDIVISEKSDVTAASDKGKNDSDAVYTNYNLKVTDSTLTATVTGGSNSALAIHCGNDNGSVLSVKNSTINASTGNVAFYNTSVWANEAVFDNSTLISSAGEGNVESYGVSIAKLEVKNGSSFICKSSAANYSLPVWSRDLTVTDSTVSAESDSATNEAYGISAANLTFNSGVIDVKAGSAADWSIGIWSDYIKINGGTLTAQTGESNNPMPFTNMPVISSEFKATVKAGSSKDSAVKVKNPAESTYTSGHFVSIEPYTHSHKWANDWSVNDNAHWHICTAEGCDITDIKDMSGYGAHKWSTEYSSDNNGHWFICTDCGQKKNEEVHTWDSVKITREATAAECGEKLFTCKCGATKTEEIAKLAPSVVEGKNVSFESGTKTELTFRSDASFADFISVTVDGSELKETDYAIKEGSIIVTLKQEYLNTLSVGTHTLSINSASGSAIAEFTVTAQSGRKDTGDSTPYMLTAVITLASLAAVAIVWKKKRG